MPENGLLNQQGKPTVSPINNTRTPQAGRHSSGNIIWRAAKRSDRPQQCGGVAFRLKESRHDIGAIDMERLSSLEQRNIRLLQSPQSRALESAPVDISVIGRAGCRDEVSDHPVRFTSCAPCTNVIVRRRRDGVLQPRDLRLIPARPLGNALGRQVRVATDLFQAIRNGLACSLNARRGGSRHVSLRPSDPVVVVRRCHVPHSLESRGAKLRYIGLISHLVPQVGALTREVPETNESFVKEPEIVSGQGNR